MNPEDDLRSARVRELAREIFTTPEAASEWFTHPAPALGGRRPADLLATEKGTRAVADVLLGMAHGNVM